MGKTGKLRYPFSFGILEIVYKPTLKSNFQYKRVPLEIGVAGKHLPGSSVSGAGAELGIDGGVLNVLVAQPVLGKVNVFTGVQDVGAYGMFEGVELLLLFGMPAAVPYFFIINNKVRRSMGSNRLDMKR